MEDSFKKVVLMIALALILIPSTVRAREFSNNDLVFMASILRGETVPNCNTCHEWIACTLISDARRYREQGRSIRSLRPNRWRAFWQNPSQEYIDIMYDAAHGNLCQDSPRCKFVGNANDYRYNWTNFGDAKISGTTNGLVVCVPYNKEAGGKNQMLRWQDLGGLSIRPY